MATDQSSYHHYYQIVSKFRRKNCDSLTNLNAKHESTQAAVGNKRTKMKKSSKFLPIIENKSHLTTSALRRRFSLFRPKRSFHSNEFEEIIDQLRDDLQKKSTEIEMLKNGIDSNPFQSTLHAKFDAMRRENDLLKKSIEELESFAQRYQSKNERERVFFYCLFISTWIELLNRRHM